MNNNYEAPQAIEIGRAHELVLSEKLLAYNVDNLGVILYRHAFTFDDYEE